MSYGRRWCEKVRLIKKRILGKGHQMTRVLQPQRERERERAREREREWKGGNRKKTWRNIMWATKVHRRLGTMSLRMTCVISFYYGNSHTHCGKSSAPSFRGREETRRFYTETLLYRDAFTHRRFYRQTFLHRHFHTETLLHAQKLLHTDTLTHRPFYTHIVLHTDAFTHKGLYTEAFTHRHFYRPTFLHTDPFTHRHIYTQKLLHQDAFPQTLLLTDSCTHRRFYRPTLLEHIPTRNDAYDALVLSRHLCIHLRLRPNDSFVENAVECRSHRLVR